MFYAYRYLSLLYYVNSYLHDVNFFPCTLTIDQLTITDLRVIRQELWVARKQWLDIGIELNLQYADLQLIERVYSDPSTCLTEMLGLWLKQVNPLPTWSAIVTALRCPVVGHIMLAKEIEMKHITEKRECNNH